MITVFTVIPISNGPSVRSVEPTAEQFRHDNPHWPVRSPDDAANALLVHGDCPWHCSTKTAAIIVSKERPPVLPRPQRKEVVAIANALGLLNLTISEFPTADRHVLVELAAAHGYHLTHVLTIDADTYMPATLMLYSAHTVRASAILAPGLEHFGPATEVLPLACTLVVPEITLARRPGWTPNP